MIGKTLAHYEIQGCLGEGGSGVVYRGRDLRLERQVAIKVLADDLRNDELAWARLLREARLASQLNHPHIAAIYDLGEEEGRAYIAMEYVEGMPLAEIIPEGGMAPEQVARYAAQIAGALAFAHEQGIIHGDLKGSNILVTPEGNIKLLDFGLGRRIPRSGMAQVTTSCLTLTEAGATAGTLPYLAPEVLRGNPTSLQSDIWALGVLFYQMALGELPFRGATPFELSVEIMVGKPQKLEKLAEPLQSTVRRCLEKNPVDRIPHGRDLVSALAGNAGEAGPGPEPLSAVKTAADPGSTDEHTKLTTAHSHRKWWAAGAVATLCVLLLAGIYARHVWVLRNVPHKTFESTPPKPAAVENPEARVWVNTNSGTYHCPGTRWYGRTKVGEYMTQKQARAKGYDPAANRACM
ncbi:MAG: serine/threonine-protein kinase [Acidobacteriota bacterium]|nr:serine/threonine-protein kinase [Acidobacteriota bacterium]